MKVRIWTREDGDLEVVQDGADDRIAGSMYAVIDEQGRRLIGCTLEGRVEIGPLPAGYGKKPGRQHYVFMEQRNGDDEVLWRRAMPVVE